LIVAPSELQVPTIGAIPGAVAPALAGTQAEARRAVTAMQAFLARFLSGLDTPGTFAQVFPWGNKWGNTPHEFQPIPT
jgi:hypothetical protein